ncbi:hypothetical protein MHH81_05615 [Psychrobacillus sp. FSL H8-0484]
MMKSVKVYHYDAFSKDPNRGILQESHVLINQKLPSKLPSKLLIKMVITN